jgi:hypothetical protein
MAGTLFRFTGFWRGLRISCCIVGMAAFFVQSRSRANAHIIAGECPHHLEPKCGACPIAFSFNTEDLGGLEPPRS